MQFTLGFVLDGEEVIPVWIGGQRTQFGYMNVVWQPTQYNGEHFILFGVDEAAHPVQDDGTLVPPDEYWRGICERRFHDPKVIVSEIRKQLQQGETK